ncbi:MAG: glycosyltransferase [Muribaculaceae bacterium]
MERDNQKVMVAIRCITYNHEPYIRDALEGFVMQKTNFSFVAIVHDDASTDGTAAIIREYAEKYPDIIKPIYETENQYSKRDGSLSRIMNAACEATGAKYIAFCEGDDYWTDSLKLQKQVDFLEHNLEYGMCCTKSLRFYVESNKFEDLLVPPTLSLDQLLLSNTLSTPTVILRADLMYDYYDSGILDEIKEQMPIVMGDYPLWLWVAWKSKIYYISSPTVVYRVVSDSASRGNYKKWLKFMCGTYSIQHFFTIKIGKQVSNDIILRSSIVEIAHAIEDNNREKITKIQKKIDNLPYNTLLNYSKVKKLILMKFPKLINYFYKWRYSQENSPSWIYVKFHLIMELFRK